MTMAATSSSTWNWTPEKSPWKPVLHTEVEQTVGTTLWYLCQYATRLGKDEVLEEEICDHLPRMSAKEIKSTLIALQQVNFLPDLQLNSDTSSTISCRSVYFASDSSITPYVLYKGMLTIGVRSLNDQHQTIYPIPANPPTFRKDSWINPIFDAKAPDYVNVLLEFIIPAKRRTSRLLLFDVYNQYYTCSHKFCMIFFDLVPSSLRPEGAKSATIDGIKFKPVLPRLPRELPHLDMCFLGDTIQPNGRSLYSYSQDHTSCYFGNGGPNRYDVAMWAVKSLQYATPPELAKYAASGEVMLPQAFLDELNLLQQLRHPSLAPVPFYGGNKTFHWFIYATFDCTLHACLQVTRNDILGPDAWPKSSFDLPMVHRFGYYYMTVPLWLILRGLVQVAEGIEYLHSKDRVHGAVSTRTIMRNFPQPQFLLVDYSSLHRKPPLPWVHRKDDYPISYVDACLTPECFGMDRFEKPADVFAFGIVLWECFHHTFARTTVREVVEGIVAKETSTDDIWTKEMNELYEDCTQRDPESRPPMNTVVTRLQAIVKVAEAVPGQNYADSAQIFDRNPTLRQKQAKPNHKSDLAS